MEGFLLVFVIFNLAHSVNAYSTGCTDFSDLSVRNLTFPGGEINQMTNLTWGQQEFGPKIECVSQLA